MNRSILSIAMPAVFLASANMGFAADLDVSQDQIQSAFDISFGASVTTNYISRGSTQTEDNPAIQGYIEGSYDMFYAGVWASNVRFSGVDDAEIDLYAGVRPEYGPLSLDLGFVQYVYLKDSAKYGEFYAKANYAFTDILSAGAEIYADPYNSTEWGALKTAITLPQDFELSGRVGSDLQSGGKVAWDAGISKTFADIATVDLRYHDSNVDPARIVATVSFSTSWSALRGK